jgi:segregation and condensation protein A
MDNHHIDDEKSGELKKHTIHIDNFDGPLDLLWDLIKKSKIDITEISISSVTEQYLQYLKLMEDLNVQIATEFIWMASELLYYKSKALLPAEELDDEFFVPPLPPELINKLLEYKKFQKSSDNLKELYEYRSEMLEREGNTGSLEGEEDYCEISLFDLLKAFASVLESQSVIEEEEVVFDEIHVSDRIEYIKEILLKKELILFTDIYKSANNRIEILTSFLAILEMARTRHIKIVQHRVFGEIRISRRFKPEELS